MQGGRCDSAKEGEEVTFIVATEKASVSVARKVKELLGQKTASQEWAALFEQEDRAFCPTGPGGGIKNNCGGKEGGGGDDDPSSIPAGDPRLVNYKPFEPAEGTKNSLFSTPPSEEEVKNALNVKQREKFGAQRGLPAGTPVDLRIDINAFKRHKVYAVTAHEHESGTQVGTPIGYDTHMRLKGPVEFSANEDSAQAIGMGKAKGTHSTVKGLFDPSRDIPEDIDSWTPVGYDPYKATYYYNKRSGQEVLSGTDAVSVGNTVFTREPKYGDRNAKTHYRSLEEMMAVDSWGLESRAFCATGEGGGVDNSCGLGDKGPKMAPDTGAGGGGSGESPKTPSEKYGPSMTPDDVPQTSVSETKDSDAFLASRNTGAKRPENFSELDRERLEKATKFLSKDGKSGCLVDESGDLGNVFNNGGVPGAGMDAVLKAIETGGAQTLDCYDDFLPWKYAQVGFVPVAKVRWSDEHAPANWDYEQKGRPDVVIMAYQGGDRSTIRSRVGSFKPYEPIPDDRYTDDFDAAKRTARLSSDPPRRTEGRARQHGPGEGRGVRPLDLGAPEGVARRGDSSVDARAYCPTGPGGGVDNSCSSKDGGSSPSPAATSTPREVVNVVQQAISSPATVRSPDGKTIESSSVGTREDGSIYRFAGREYVSTVAAGKHLTEMQAQARGEPINSGKPLSAADRDYVAGSHVAQVQAAAARGIKPVFYTPEERQLQLEEYSRIEPRVLGGRTKAGFEVTPENAEFLFRAVQALTSSNATPFANMQRTDAVLSKVFDDDGRVSTSTSFGVTGGAIKKSLSRLQAVIDTLGRRPDGSVDPAMGLDKTRELFVGTTMRVGDIDKFMRGEFGGDGPAVKTWKPSSYLVDQEVPLFSTFGPKFGPFFANNTGDPSHLTADIWATRTWGRITGELVQEAKSEKAKDHAKSLLKAVKGANASQLHGVDGDQLVASLKKMAATGEIDDVVRAWSGERLRHYASTDYTEKRGTAGKLNKLAKNVAENDTSLMGDPGSGRRRANMIDVYRTVQEKTGLPVAYAQDVLWQDEQDAYAALGAKTATEQGKLSFYSDEIRRIADDPSYRIARAKKERRDSLGQPVEFYDDYERGGRDNLLYWEAISHLTDDQFVKLLLDIDGKPAERRAFCPTGEGGGVDPSCSSSDGGGPSAPAKSGSPSPTKSGPEVKIGDKREEIDRRLEGMGINLDAALDITGGSRAGTYIFVRRDVDKPSEPGVHIECTRDVAGVKDGMFSQTVIRNSGPENDPEIVVDHKLMEVKPEVAADPEKRHAAAREFFRTMTESVQASVRKGASKVVLNAAGSSTGKNSFRGYTIWPRMGFDAPIPNHIRGKLPESLGHCRTLLDLHATPEGTRWWKKNGTDLDVQLDLKRADSPQMQVFGKFVRHFEKDRRDLAYGTGEDWLSPADEVRLEELWEEVWDEGLLDDYSGEGEEFSEVGESRAFCPTGEGNGVKNDCPPASAGEGSVSMPKARYDDPRNKESWLSTSGDFHPVDRVKAPMDRLKSPSGFNTHDAWARKYGVEGGEKELVGKGWMRVTAAGKTLYINSEKTPTERQKKAAIDHALAMGTFEDVVYDPGPGGKQKTIWSARAAKQAGEDRAFCPTGPGGGKDNSCSSSGSTGPDGKAWGGKAESWGRSSETEIWTPDKPLFRGADRFAVIKIHRPNDVKGQIEDGLKMSIADAVLAAGPVSSALERAAITKPRLEIISSGHGIEMHWTAMGVATGQGYSEDEKQFAPRPGTAVKAVEASRDIWNTKSGPVLHMGGFFIHPDFQGKGIGVESVLHSTSSPVVRLEMQAERFDHPNPNTRMTGYKVWPKYGYDAPMSVVRAALKSGSVPSFLSKAKTLSDVFATPGGREWWAESGGSIKLVFDRSPRSRSWHTLLKYTDRPRSNRSMATPEKIGRDSDYDEAVESFWSRVLSGEETLPGEAMTQEEYDRWAAESKEAAKDGSSGEVQPH